MSISIEELSKVACRSHLLKYKTGAALVKDRQVVAIGWSHLGLKLTNTYSVHAEQHALWRALHLDLEGAVCYTATVRKNRVFAALPCVACAHSLINAGITTVVTDGSTFVLPDMLRELKKYNACTN